MAKVEITTADLSDIFSQAGADWNCLANHVKDGIVAGEYREKADECYRISKLLNP